MFKLDWLSATEDKNQKRLVELSQKLAKYYSNRTAYYDYISEEDPWTYLDYPPSKEIVKRARESNRILELGCGRASILNVDPSLENRYTGLEFSSKIIDENKNRFPTATFDVIKDPNYYDLEDASFDLVFSFFVIEHTIFPDLFLKECMRLLKPGGTLIVFAPNFLDNNWVVSQRVASNSKGGIQNLKEGNLKNALTGLLYGRLLIPIYCRYLKSKGRTFWINCDPACFYFDEILPDLDACYITSFDEIRKFVRDNGMNVLENDESMDEFIKKRRLGFLIANKR